LTQRHDVWCTCTVIYDLQYCGCCGRLLWECSTWCVTNDVAQEIVITTPHRQFNWFVCVDMYHQEYCDLTRAPASISQRTGCWLVVTQIVCCAVNTLKENIEESQWCIARGAASCLLHKHMFR
jgi:hypothetical protein